MDGYTISTDASLFDFEVIHGYLSRESYRAAGRSMETVRRSIVQTKRMQLATRDAHELYRHYGGFTPLAAPERCMERVQEKS